MANTDYARKLLVRTALVTSTTIATLVGAQNFAMLDARTFQLTGTPLTDHNSTQTSVSITQSAPQITIFHAAPGITVLRQSGQVNTTVAVQPVRTNTNTIQPPIPAQISAPQPIIIQQPAPQTSAASR